MIRPLVFAGFMLLGACATPGMHAPTTPVGSQRLLFACADGLVAAVHHRQDWVDLQVDSASYTLPQVVAASGARYQEGDTLYWNRGSEALIVIDGRELGTCTLDLARQPRHPEGSNLVVWRAQGNEPGWLVEIGWEGEIGVLLDYGSISHVFPYTPPQGSASELYYELSASEDMSLLIRAASCQDSMSGQSFDYQATLAVGDRHLDGCAARLSD